MDYCTPQSSRRHNPVDSICRKLQTIQWRGDRKPNSPFQIPKLSSNNYDSPQSGLRHNLDTILKKGTLHREQVEQVKGRGMGTSSFQRSSLGPSIPPLTPSTPACNPSTPTNIAYTITSSLGERRSADGSDLIPVETWRGDCSTPMGPAKDAPYFTFTRGSRSGKPENERPSSTTPLSRTFTPNHGNLSYNLNFCSVDKGNSTECELSYPALVVKRLSMGDGVASENRKESMAEMSLISEENLLDTIFHACDTKRRGRVYVSHIVDYLRHTTSRSSEDSGLEDLCNMLDPEREDVSIDLDTYHAVMKEWIDDCRNNGEETTDDIIQDSVKLRDSLSAKRSMLLNMTSGSLEAFGGEASRAEFETSELVNCVADLQMNNQKLLEEVRKLKQAVEGMEEGNQKLAEENEELRNQARVNQQLAQKEKMLKEEVEEMKATLCCTEEGRARASAHCKHAERESKSLIAEIASLQEENFKVAMETDELQRKITELCDINTDLQVQIHSLDAVVGEKETGLQEKRQQINELKSTVEEYSFITELLRADKRKLENQMRMIQPYLSGAGLSVAYRLNLSSSGSLQTELALAQSPLEASLVVDHVSNTMSCISLLDETLDREVLLMLQGPNPDHMALQFKNLIHALKKDFIEETNSVLSTARGWLEGNTDASLQTVQAELDARRADWALSLDQLAQYTDSLEKELIKMASNMRRSRTEILHLSVRVQEQENQKRQLSEELEQLKAPQDNREASCQTPLPEEEPGDDLYWDEEFDLQDPLKNELKERNCKENGGRTDRDQDVVEKWTVVDTSTPLSALSGEAQPGQCATGGDQDTAACTEPEEPAVPLSTHSQAVSIRQPEADALSDILHSENSGTPESPSCGQTQNLSKSSEQDQTVSLGNTPPTASQMVPPSSTSPGRDGTITHTGSTQPTSEQHHGGEEEKEGGVDPSTAAMSRTKSPSRDQSADRSAAEDGTCVLPVLVEEEESTAEVPTVAVTMEGTEQLTSSAATTPTRSGSTVTQANQSGSGLGSVTSDPSQSEDSAAKKDSVPVSGKNKRELEQSGSMEGIEEPKAPEDQSETSVATDKEPKTSVNSDTGVTSKEDSKSLLPNDKETEAEFQRLALGFKCDMFTLEKRLRLEERSRDLAEENVRKEVSSCQGLLQALTPLCDDSQSMEIIQRLEKNLEILIQSMARVSSRSEMLGAIHQESRIGKAVEVMILHVENLRRMYTKEHAELLELREALVQNERSFGSQTERDDFRGKKQTTQYYKQSSTRRVSIAAIPRSGGANMQFDMTKAQDGSEAETERLTRRSPWTPCNTDCQWQDRPKDEPAAEKRRSSLSELGSKLTSLLLPLKTSRDELFITLPSPPNSPMATDPGMIPSLPHSLTSSWAAATAPGAKGGRGVWLWLAMVVVLAGLLALLASLAMQPAVDAAPVGTGDSWMTIQQMLWPYTGLRHHGQPPV
ncbi:inositol 1,4,5-triphosphate receptor associated 2 isoform X4 [Pseudoliparis swirei]|uniref:inositol 1,4,5-triphosphate receptor associated 2 isoform X4 n=1 Tax=Pseudoliparis swirei TaxID=2059687 RepID=UPI0024BE12CE|nr:inositol 1,4,5-triphosphate receptor associated 2 isoform X4 [Pseudoliparis swirei]